MKWSAIKFIFMSLVLILLQACVFSHIYLFGYAVAFIFIYIIVALPYSLSLSLLYTVGFISGLIVDIFCDTLGVNALAATILAALRRPIFKLYHPKNEDLGSDYIDSKTIGWATYSKYALSMSLVYCVLAFLLESFSFIYPLRFFINVFASTLFTFIVILVVNSLNTQHEKRL